MALSRIALFALALSAAAAAAAAQPAGPDQAVDAQREMVRALRARRD